MDVAVDQRPRRGTRRGTPSEPVVALAGAGRLRNGEPARSFRETSPDRRSAFDRNRARLPRCTGNRRVERSRGRQQASTSRRFAARGGQGPVVGNVAQSDLSYDLFLRRARSARRRSARLAFGSIVNSSSESIVPDA